MKKGNIKRKIKAWIENLSLQKKIFSIVLIVILLLSNSTLLISYYLSSSYNKLLYDKTADNISVTSSYLEDELDSDRRWMASIVTDPKIQQYLVDVKDHPDEFPYDIRNSIHYRLSDFAFQLRNNSVSFLLIKNSQFTTKYGIKKGADIAEEDLKEICKKASENVTGAVFIDDYVSQYGLLMVQKIRRIANSKLDGIGYLIVGIDQEQLMKKIDNVTGMSYNTEYIVYGNTDFLFSSMQKDCLSVQQKDDLSEDYDIISVDGKKYFGVYQKLKKYDIEMYTLTSYENIFHMLGIIRFMMIGSVIVCIAIVLLLTGWLIKNLTRHFDSLVMKMRTFRHENGEILYKDPYDYSTRRDEIGVLHQNFDKMADKISNLITVNYKNEIAMHEAKFKALETQINPHFLYNTLQSINFRAKLANQKDISKMTEALGTLLHTSLAKGDSFFTIQEELQFLDAYITIQKYRFEEELQFNRTVDSSLLKEVIPRLTIQPIVDNAVRYGLEKSIDGGTVDVTIYAKDEEIWIDVKNTGSQFEENLLEKLKSGEVKQHGNGVGLVNIQERIQMVYGAGYGLTLFNEKEWAVARVRIPKGK